VGFQPDDEIWPGAARVVVEPGVPRASYADALSASPTTTMPQHPAGEAGEHDFSDGMAPGSNGGRSGSGP
jgi:hypothetical protein